MPVASSEEGGQRRSLFELTGEGGDRGAPSVIDDGPGIPGPTYRGFDRLDRADSSRTRAQRGAGLGARHRAQPSCACTAGGSKPARCPVVVRHQLALPAIALRNRESTELLTVRRSVRGPVVGVCSSEAKRHGDGTARPTLPRGQQRYDGGSATACCHETATAASTRSGKEEWRYAADERRDEAEGGLDPAQAKPSQPDSRPATADTCHNISNLVLEEPG